MSPVRRTTCSVIFLLGSAVIGYAQQNPCDKHLVQSASDPNGYRLRGDRCEGSYLKDVAGTSGLSVVSFSELFEDFDARSGQPLHVSWRAPSNSAVHLMAMGLRPRLWYQMDMVRTGGAAPYDWSTGVLSALNVAKKDLGVVAWTAQKIGGETRDLYLPLRLTQQQNPGPSATYQLVVWSGTELAELVRTLTPVGSDGRPGTPLIREKPLHYGYYPAERGIPISISNLPASGLYKIDLGATLRGGGSSSLQIWFYHRPS